jgi:hypothetical protein
MGHILLPSSPVEQLLYSTVRITARDVASQEWFGTGFVFQLPLENGLNAPFLVTNRHVLENAVYVRAVFHRSKADADEPSGYYNGCDLNVEPQAVIFHSDPAIDLAALPLATVLDQWADDRMSIYFKAISTQLVPSPAQWSEFDALEDIIMIGCPNGLYDAPNNFAIFRKGTTASPLSVPHNGDEEFLADIACFGGSSGSPIFTFNPNSHFNRSTGKYELGGGRFYFVGVLYAGPIYKHQGQVIMKTPVVNISTTMHLGFAIRSTEVVRMLQDFLISRDVAVQDPYVF